MSTSILHTTPRTHALSSAYNFSVHYAVFNSGHSEHMTPLDHHVPHYGAQINYGKTQLLHFIHN
jgi:hypothetical protein